MRLGVGIWIASCAMAACSGRSELATDALAAQGGESSRGGGGADSRHGKGGGQSYSSASSLSGTGRGGSPGPSNGGTTGRVSSSSSAATGGGNAVGGAAFGSGGEGKTGGTTFSTSSLGQTGGATFSTGGASQTGGATGSGGSGPLLWLCDIDEDGCVGYSDWLLLVDNYDRAVSDGGDPRADFDSDGSVTNRDVDMFYANWLLGCAAETGLEGSMGPGTIKTPGDITGDGCVDIADWGIFSSCISCPVGPGLGDRRAVSPLWTASARPSRDASQCRRQWQRPQGSETKPSHERFQACLTRYCAVF